MSKHFYAVNKKTRERWRPSGMGHQYLVMYDSGYLAVVTEDFYTYIEPLNPSEWLCVKRKEPSTTS